MKRLYPHPTLSVTLVLLWFLLVNHWTLGSLILAVILATFIPLLSAQWWPERPAIRRPFALVAYPPLGIVRAGMSYLNINPAFAVLLVGVGTVWSFLQGVFILTTFFGFT